MGADVFKQRQTGSAAESVRRSEPIAAEMQAMRGLHEDFAGRFARSLSAMLHCETAVKLLGLEQLAYREFAAAVEKPTCFALLEAESQDRHLAMDIGSSLLYPIIDRLLGGAGPARSPARRSLTPIETRLVSRVVGVFLGELHHVWADVFDLKLKLARIENRPPIADAVPPNDPIVVIRFEVAFGGARGPLSLCLPYHFVEQARDRLLPLSPPPSDEASDAAETLRPAAGALRSPVVELAVRLASTRIAREDLVGIGIGDIITTEKNVSRPLVVCVENVPKFLASPGAYQGRKAIRIEEAIADPTKKIDD